MAHSLLCKHCSHLGGDLDIATEIKEQQPLIVQQARHVHTITDRFSRANTYLVNDEEFCFVVDPGSVLNTQLTLHYLQRFLHRTLNDIDLIVLTHLHPDHTDGVEALRKACKAPVAASIVAQQLVQSGQDGNRQESWNRPGMSHFVGHMLSQYPLPGALHHLDLFPPRYEQQVQMVDIWLEDVAGLPNHPNWRVIASPGHTPESLCLYNPFSYELVCGDTVVTLEGGATLVHGNTHQRTLEMTLQTLRSLNVLYLYPGHGRPIISKHAMANIRIDS
jgi:hydroxyacylglutathione hydrolase